MTKTVNGVVTTYYYQGSLLISEYTDTETIVYIYDSKGLPIGFRYRTSTYADGVWDTYWYGRNPIGDIVSVYSSSAVKLVSYYYDAWGNTTIFYSNNGSSTTAVKNNLTYRGYYYESDMSMYYLQSRYYDSNTGRFINADSILVDSLLGYNQFAYCENNPVNKVDPTGYFANCVDYDGNYDFLDDSDKFAGRCSSGSGNSVSSNVGNSGVGNGSGGNGSSSYIDNAKNSVISSNAHSTSRGVGGKGWIGDKTWRANVETVGKGGTIESLDGGIPTEYQAKQLINQSGGMIIRIEWGHSLPNPHTYRHINYLTGSGVKGTLRIYEG